MPRKSTRLTFAVLATGAGVFSMLQSLIAPALPTVQHALHTSQSTATWVMTAYLLSASVFTPILGRVGDLAGKKRTLVAVLVTVLAGCLVAALAPNIGVLIVARIVQGVGGALFPLSFGIIRDEFAAAEVPGSISNLSAVIAAGGGVGIVAAGPIVSALDYRWLFWIPVAIVAATVLIAARYVPESPKRAEGKVSWAGAGLLSGWLVALLLPLSQATRWGWGSPEVLGLFTAAVVLFALWLTAEARSRSPLIDLRVMRLPAVWTTNTAALLFGAGMYAIWSFLPGFVQTPSAAGYGFGASVTASGLLMLPMLVAMFLSGVLSGRLEPRVGAKALLTAGAALGAVACGLLTLRHDEQWQIAVVAGLFGLGIGLAFASMANLVVGSVPPEQTGAATGMNANIRTIGGSVGAALTSVLVTGRLQPSGLPYESGYTHAWALLSVLLLAAAGAALLVPVRRPGRTVHTAPAESTRAPAQVR
ncbi:drug resistance transporter, EmrB/QacA subfamily [Streptomyces sp. 1222.5]|uniref:MFS transporter n=1 Tax=unclassified Streptomyces TaxID=2593676 RepID=UPI00089CA0E9|nr:MULTISPECIES: MFS transporter [unclassified Streptomyces]PKW11351.1 EmrB/QacA subfamily drug resistance transporter [Streptomyces sp. 5112.2]SEB81231.1 drug resistance transporter, EmrB/QacA subfamily [Streptomyces sp. 1222.5]SEE09248.1 drug resistance transporter, EmrB/QacA subfamily [Streptomyces sp. 2231.1]